MWYIRYTHAFQHRLSPILTEIIHLNQIAFYLVTIPWNMFSFYRNHWIGPNEWNEVLCYLNLILLKHITRFFWDFLFGMMETFGMAREFIHMVCILFLEVEVVVNVNGIPLSTFPIWKGIQQRCPIVLYLFILIGKTFNVIAKRTMEYKEIEGVMLFNKVNQHVDSQYVDDKLFTIKGKRETSII